MSRSHRIARIVLPLVTLTLSVTAACSSAPERTELRAAVEARDAGADPSAVSADTVEIVKGVPDKSRDPAVIALMIGNDALCSGSLVSPTIVLTARHCVSETTESVECPASGVQVLKDRDPKTFTVLVGDDISSAHAVARGAAVVAPSGVTLCDADMAFVILDRPVSAAEAKPLAMRSVGVKVGDRLRAVGFGKSSDASETAGIKLVREHVKVLGVTSAEFEVGEATCQGDSGGPALDEDTGEIVGVVSRGGPTCDGANVHNIYTRVDAFTWLADEAFARASGLGAGGDVADAGVDPAKRGTKQKPASDVGGPCDSASDCAAGICISDGEAKYCSRSCGSGDRCPNGYHCTALEDGSEACVSAK